MKIALSDITSIRRSLVAFIALTALGAAAVLAVLRIAADAKHSHRQALAQRDNLLSQLARTGSEENEIRTRIGRYREIQARGIVGQEHRLEWVERIAQIRKVRRLGDIQYELAPQKPAQLPGGSTVGGYEFMVSTMKLQMTLLHEDDLLGFLADLAGSVPAFPRVRVCNVERSADATPGTGTRLRADCTVDWITLREKT